MSRLDELIQQYCPDGVEYKNLGVAVSIERGKRLVRGQLSNDCGYPVFQNSMTPLGYHTDYNYPENTAFIIGAGAAGEIGFSSVKFWAADDCYPMVCREDISSRYLYHALLRIQPQIKSRVRKASIPRLSRASIEQFEIPVPPLPVQREIVRILDKFTELTAALIAELTARKKQYGCYRDSLLSFAGNTDVKNVPLGDIAKFVYGYTDKAKETGSVRFVRITDISEDGKLNPYDAKYVELTEESKKYLLEKGDLLLARTGATYGKTLYFEADEPAVYASFLIKIILDNSVIKNRYYWHFSKSSLYWEQAERYVSKGGQQQFNTNAVSRVKVPVPSLEVQDKIIYVLDNFDAICSDLKIGLPAEIEARKKQYEFYREKLLAFHEISN